MFAGRVRNRQDLAGFAFFWEALVDFFGPVCIASEMDGAGDCKIHFTHILDARYPPL